MDRVLLGESLPIAFSIPDRRIPPSSRRITSPVRDVWSREFRERTSDTAHRRSPEFAIRWTSNVNCDNPRKFGRIDESDALPGADEGEREEIRREATHGFLD